MQETVIRGGTVSQRNLCEACARAKGVKQGPPNPLAALAQAVLVQGAGAKQAEPPVSAASLACSVCGLTYAQFRTAGMLGCPACYEAFAAQLFPLVARAHEGATHHVGKVPKRGPGPRADAPTRAAALFGTANERRERSALLRKQLAEAVAAEQYERAAQLRDELRRLAETGPSVPPMSPGGMGGQQGGSTLA